MARGKDAYVVMGPYVIALHGHRGARPAGDESHLGLWWAVLSGLFVGSVYASFWTGGWPLHSQFTTRFPIPAAAVGVAAWWLLVLFTVATLRRRSPAP